MIPRLLALGGIWIALAAATPAPIVPPPPDVAALVPFAQAPLDKPLLAVEVALPPSPVPLPTLPPARVTPPPADKPVAFLGAPRTLPCAGAWLGIPSESLECGRARLSRGELDDAAKALEQASRAGSDRELLREARYWLGETYYQLGRFEQADYLFRQVAQDSPRHEWGAWALFSAGWTALRLGAYDRARDTFTSVLSGVAPAALDGWSRHGLALAQYALGRYAEAEQAWGAVEGRAPAPLARDVLFWRGDTLGRLQQYTRAEETLRRFTDGGGHLLLDTGLVHLGWWTLATGRAPESAATFRQALSHTLPAGTRDWADAGLALALMHGGDWTAARNAGRPLVTRRSTLAQPIQLALLRGAIEAPTGDADALAQELLAGSLPPAVRGWVLLVKGEVERARGNRDEARTSFDLARKVEPQSATAWQAAYRLARVNAELREFKQAVVDVTPVTTARLSPELRVAALLLLGEAAYAAGDFATSAAAFRRLIADFPSATEAPAARLGLAWSSLRLRRTADARREFLEFARARPDARHADEALLLASELAFDAGDLEGARTLVDGVIAAYPSQPLTDFARFNRGVLLLRTGRAAEARTALAEWLRRASFPALAGRAHAALGVAALEAGDVPAAAAEFALARRDGAGALSELGLGATALVQRQLDEAAAAFGRARDGGPPGIVAAAEYGLAVVAHQRGATRDFKKPALLALDAARSRPDRAAPLLYALTGIAIEERDWSNALGHARRLAGEHAQSDIADDALERVGAAAVAAHAWPVVYDAYTLLRQRFPQSPFTPDGRIRAAEAAIESGRVDVARRELEEFVAAAPNDPRAPRALLLLARAREKAGDRAGALDAYARASREGQDAQWSKETLFAHARLLAQERRWEQSRAVLDKLLKSSEREVSADAARALGDVYAAEGDTLAAAEYWLSAGYMAPQSPGGRRALLEAAKTLASLKQTEAAAGVYRRLLAQADLPPDVAGAARQGLTALGQRP